MKIYLLNPPFYPHFGRGARWQDTSRGGTLYYPIWLSYAAAILDQSQDVKLVDAPARGWEKNEVLLDIDNFNPELIVIDSSFPSLNNDIHIAEHIKERHPNSIIVLVGPPTSQYPEKILKSDGIDIVARWEYDFTLRDLVDTILNNGDLSSVDGISYCIEGEIFHVPDRKFSNSADLDTIPFVSKIYKKFLHIENYFLGQSLYPEIQIFTGRGCPNQCTFCAWPQTLTGRKYRVRSISNVIEELVWIEKNLKIREVFFEDDTFTISKERVLEFCNSYLEQKLTVTWSCNARVNTLDLDTMIAMKKANCRLLIAGYESGVDSILQTVKKGITTKDIRQFSYNARKAGLLVHGDIIIGLPGETKDTINLTKKMILELRPDILQVAVASPFPGTEFYSWCKTNGYLLTDDPNEYLDEAGHQKAIISYPNLSNEEMVNQTNIILREYYLSLRYIPLVMKQVIRRNSFAEVRRIWFSAKMFLGYI